MDDGGHCFRIHHPKTAKGKTVLFLIHISVYLSLVYYRLVSFDCCRCFQAQVMQFYRGVLLKGCLTLDNNNAGRWKCKTRLKKKI